ncbi:MAG: hypothetical protein ACYTFY_20480 [Planctomycetota bacterium]
MESFSVKTVRRSQMVDITREVEKVVRKNDFTEQQLLLMKMPILLSVVIS